MRTRLAGSTFGLLVGVSAAVAAVSIIAPAAAQDKPVHLKFASGCRRRIRSPKAAGALGESIQAATNGTVKVALFPSQQLGKAFDHYDMARDGIADLT